MGEEEGVAVEPEVKTKGSKLLIVGNKSAVEECAAEINNAIDGTIYAESSQIPREHFASIRLHLLKAGSALNRIRDTRAARRESAIREMEAITMEDFVRQDRWYGDDLWRAFVDAKRIVKAALLAVDASEEGDQPEPSGHKAILE